MCRKSAVDMLIETVDRLERQSKKMAEKCRRLEEENLSLRAELDGLKAAKKTTRGRKKKAA